MACPSRRARNLEHETRNENVNDARDDSPHDSASARGHSAVDAVVHAGEPLAAVGDEERDDLGDVLGAAKATERNGL